MEAKLFIHVDYQGMKTIFEFVGHKKELFVEIK